MILMLFIFIPSGEANRLKSGDGSPDGTQDPPPASILISHRCSDYAAPAVPSPSVTYYVDGDAGNDNNNGLSHQTAWKTLIKANHAATPGALFLLSGTFGSGQNIQPDNSGTATNRITYRREPGYSAVLEIGRFDATINLSGLDYIVVDGVEIRNTDLPFKVYEGSNNWLRNLYVHHSGSSFFQVNSHDNRLEDSVFINIGHGNESDAIRVISNSDNNIVVRNYFGKAGHGGYDDIPMGDDTQIDNSNIVAQNIMDDKESSNIVLGGKAFGTIVECNEVKNGTLTSLNNYARMGIQISGNSNIVRYNYIHNNTGPGLLFEALLYGGEQPQYPKDNLVYHNTIVDNGLAGVLIDVRDPDGVTAAYVRNNTIENNIFWNNGGSDGGNGQSYEVKVDFFHTTNPWPVGFSDGNIFRYNNVSNRPFLVIARTTGNSYYPVPSGTPFTTDFPAWTNNTQQDPLFTNPGTHNYSLQSGSPMINTGRIISGLPYVGSAPDRGAFEYGGADPLFPGPIPVAPEAIEAENFDAGGEGVAYHDNDTGNSSGGYRTSDNVDIIARTAASNGYAVNSASAGEWLRYTFVAPAS
ncbi:MAG: hypothetical protein JOZ52_07570, partial [Acidobacteria bacterium]|nr:hypothetical protein [Acidobacteriota bacterium]